MTRIRLVYSAILTFFVASAYAYGPVMEFDADGSGELSFDEFVTYLKSVKDDVSAAADEFIELDADESGTLSSAELPWGQSKTSAGKIN